MTSMSDLSSLGDAFDPATFRSVMSSYPTGVTIVSAAAEDGTLCGMTANSFTSVSLDPPIVLVCSQIGARTCEAAKTSGRFAIHVLAHDQISSARAFVGFHAPRFDAVSHHLDEEGVPILDHWLALLVCKLHEVVRVGDHDVMFGLVERCGRADETPLLFHESALRMLPRLPALAVKGGPLSLEDDEDLNDPLVRVLAPLG